MIEESALVDGHGTGATVLTPDTRDYPIQLLPGFDPDALSPIDLTEDFRQRYDQGSEPSCVAFSTCGLTSAFDWLVDHGWDVLDGHRAYRELGGNGSSGIDTRVMLEYARSQGIPLLSGAGSLKIGSYVFANREPGQFRQEIVAALNAGHFCTIATLLPSNFGWDSSGSPNAAFYHQVVAAGATGIGDNDWMIFVNSWGPNWGRGGLGRLTWGYLEQNNLQGGYVYAYAVSPIVLIPPPPPPPVKPIYLVTGHYRSAQGETPPPFGSLTTLNGAATPGSFEIINWQKEGEPPPPPPNTLTVTGYQPAQPKKSSSFDILGSGFSAGSQVVIEGVASVSATVASPTLILAVAPAVPGPYMLRVKSGDKSALGPPLVVLDDVQPPPGDVKVDLSGTQRLPGGVAIRAVATIDGAPVATNMVCIVNGVARLPHFVPVGGKGSWSVSTTQTIDIKVVATTNTQKTGHASLTI
jgi:hypothetical protein